MQLRRENKSSPSTSDYRRTTKNYIVVQQVSKQFIIYALGEASIEALKKPYVAYGNSSVHEIFTHLYDKTAEMMTMKDKQDYLNEGYAVVWDGSGDMQAYFANIQRFELTLPDRGLDVPTGRNVLAVSAMMWDSGQFTSKQMHKWENKAAADKTWDNIKAYFTQQWQEQQAYNKMTAKQSAFKEAAMLAKEVEAAEQQAQIFVLMQTQLSSACRMSACRFCAQLATFCVVSATCRRHFSVMSQTQENVVSARVSKRHDI
jgi:hypothetical protein